MSLAVQTVPEQTRMKFFNDSSPHLHHFICLNVRLLNLAKLGVLKPSHKELQNILEIWITKPYLKNYKVINSVISIDSPSLMMMTGVSSSVLLSSTLQSHFVFCIWWCVSVYTVSFTYISYISTWYFANPLEQNTLFSTSIIENVEIIVKMLVGIKTKLHNKNIFLVSLMPQHLQ